MLLSEVSKFESSLLVIHVEKPVNGLTAANISVYDLRVEPVILFGQANGVRDLQCFGLRGTRSVFLICLEREQEINIYKDGQKLQRVGSMCAEDAQILHYITCIKFCFVFLVESINI